MLVRSLRVTNLLSFAPDSVPIEVGPLSVLIGPNGSGKSNFLEVIGVLQAAPRDLVAPFRQGGIRDWLWKGSGSRASPPVATIETILDYDERGPLRYRLSLTGMGDRLQVTDERLERAEPARDESKPFFYFGYEQGRPMISTVDRGHRGLVRGSIDPQQSILSQRQDPDLYPELTRVARWFGAIRLFREWNFGRHTSPRLPQPADQPNDFLADDASNLGLILNALRQASETKQRLLDGVRLVYEGITDVDIRIFAGAVQVVLQEDGRSIPATRLSDGTLRWLCLLAILLHPTPPPLVCIEEPELGLHPDLLPKIADLLRGASERMQLVVTTHSDVLVDALTATPEVVVVCERPHDRSTMRRLSREELKPWLEKYRLGEAWSRNLFGGNRW